MVLAQLVGAQGLVSWVGVSPGAADADGAFAVSDLEGAGVHTAWREEVGGGAGQPTAYITLSSAVSVPSLAMAHAVAHSSGSPPTGSGLPSWA